VGTLPFTCFFVFGLIRYLEFVHHCVFKLGIHCEMSGAAVSEDFMF